MATAQGPSTDPGPDPLGHIRPGDPDPTPDDFAVFCLAGLTIGQPVCTRERHPTTWQHIAGGGDTVVATWKDPT